MGKRKEGNGDFQGDGLNKIEIVFFACKAWKNTI